MCITLSYRRSWIIGTVFDEIRGQLLLKLLILRRDTLRIIDGAGPSVEAPPSESNSLEQVSGTAAEQVSSPKAQPEKPTSAPTEQVGQTLSTQNEPVTRSPAQADKKQPTKCTFSGVVPIDLSRFVESGIVHVECPDCASMRTLEPHSGVLRFKSHDKRKTTTPNTGQRWAKGETDWDVVGG